MLKLKTNSEKFLLKKLFFSIAKFFSYQSTKAQHTWIWHYRQSMCRPILHRKGTAERRVTFPWIPSLHRTQAVRNK